MWRNERLSRWLAVAMLVLLAPLASRAQDDPPGRVGRIADLAGTVWVFDNDQGEWIPAGRNRPLTNGDRIATDGDSRAALRVGSTTLRLGGASELEVLRLDDELQVFELHSGSLALRVRSREVAEQTEIVTAEARIRPLRGGQFRFDRVDDSTYAAAWRGELRVDGADESFTVDGGRRAEVWRVGGGPGSLRHDWARLPDDAFAAWVIAEDARDERSAANRYVSPEMTGAEDLERDGHWEQHADYGALWVPTVVVAGWAPYRYGHWAWIGPWGWTWVDDARWGFAPFHYGRWVSVRGRWGWAPGAYVARPVYAPALVAWVGGPQFSVSVAVGGPALPAVGWVPLAPREVYVPWYRATPRYVDRVNHYPPGRAPVPREPVMYGNQGVPGAVTVVPRDVLVRRQPVARAVVDVREQRAWPSLRALPGVAPAAPPTVAMVGPGRVATAPPPRLPRPPLAAVPPRAAVGAAPVPGTVDARQAEERRGRIQPNRPPETREPAREPSERAQQPADRRAQQGERQREQQAERAREQQSERAREQQMERARQQQAERQREQQPERGRERPGERGREPRMERPAQAVEPPARVQPPPPAPVVAAPPAPPAPPPQAQQREEGRQRIPEGRAGAREREQFR